MNTTIFKAIGLQSHFTILPNATANDTRVSALALGLLSYLLSKPEDWETSVAELRQRFASESRNDIRRAMQNLKDAGYARLETQRGKDGRVRGKVWLVSAFPFGDGTDGPDAGLSVTDGPVDRTSVLPTVGFCDTLQSKDLDKENTQTAHARENTPLVAHEEPLDEPQAPEDETPCVCEDESPAEEPQAPAAEPEPQVAPEPPAAEAFAWEAPSCEHFDVLAVRSLNQPMCPHVQGTLDLMTEVDYPCDERFYRADPQGRVHAFAHDLMPEEQRDYLRYRIATEVGERHTFLAPATCLSPAWVANGLPLARQWVAKQRAKAQQNGAGRFQPPPPEEQMGAEEVKALCARTIAEVERGPGRRRQKQEERSQDA